jgi:FkbM family methyltransferase
VKRLEHRNHITDQMPQDQRNHVLSYSGAVVETLRPGAPEPALCAPAFLTEITELDVINHIVETTRSRRTFVDIGAHIGFFSVGLASHFDHVVAYEPSRFQFSYLRSNMAPLPNAICKPVAVGRAAAKATLYVMGRSGGGNTLDGSVAATGSPMETYQVDVVTLDQENLEKVDVIKIDVEGFEHNIIIGARRIIERDAPSIYCEVWEDDYERRRFAELLNSLDYEIQYVFTQHPEIALCTPRLQSIVR